jgi:hypothetical protein
VTPTEDPTKGFKSIPPANVRLLAGSGRIVLKIEGR